MFQFPKMLFMRSFHEHLPPFKRCIGGDEKQSVSVASAARQRKRLKQETPLLALRDSRSERMKE